MARKGTASAGGGKKKRRRKKKLRLTLKSRSIKKADTYTDSVGWTNTKVLEGVEPEKTKEPEKIRHQCSLCGSMMMIPKPKRAKYTITCPSCEHNHF